MNVLFAGKPFEKLRNVLEQAFSGHVIKIVEDENLAEEISWADAVILRPMKFGKDILAFSSDLKLVQQWGVGVEGLDVKACTEYGVYACNVPSRGSGNAESVAEAAIMHMLLLSRRFFRSQEKLREGKIFTPPGRSLWGKKACIVGMGDLGHCLAERLSCLGMEVAGVNRTMRSEFKEWGVTRVYPFSEMGLAFKGSAFVILCLPLNSDTEGIIGEEELRMMEKDAFLINVARGKLLQREALEKALSEKWISGAGLDVLWDEPHSPQDPLINNDRIILTPHIGGVTDASMKGVQEFIAGNIERVSRGEKPLSCLNPDLD